MKKKLYWIKYIDMYSVSLHKKDPSIVKYSSFDFDEVLKFYNELKSFENSYVTTAYYIHSVSKSFKQKLERLENL